MQNSVIALDVGEKRIGVARVGLEAKIPQPHTTLENNSEFVGNLKSLLEEEHAKALVVGLPRNLEGKDTSQTDFTREFIDKLKQQTEIPIYTVDEAGTSKKAREELENSKKPFAKGDIDALAATYILEDFLSSHQDLVESWGSL